MNASNVKQEVLQARNDTRNALNILIDNDWNNELSIEHVDALFNLLGTASVNIGSAMNKLRSHTTYYKDDE